MPTHLLYRAPAPVTRAIRLLAVAAVAGLVAFAAYSLSGVRGETIDRLFNDGVYNALEIAAVVACCLRLAFVRQDRAAWSLITAAVASWTLADLLFTFAYDNDPPFPSIADGFYLAFYPLAYVGLLLLLRRHVADFNRSLWLDGLTAALGAAALGAAVLVEIVLETTEGSRGTVITNLAYPVGDVLLLSVVFGACALTGWRPGRAWLFVGVGLGLQVVADAAFLFQSATETYVPGAPFDVFWPTAMLLIAWAAWQVPVASAERHEATSWLATPAVAALTAIAILAFDHFHRQNPLALVFAVSTLLVILVRLRMTFRENEGMLRHIRRQAVTDALTGLGNRRSLVTDLDRIVEAAEGAPERILVIYDLNGFKRYNDTFGHPSGDQLLRRLSERLATAAAPFGSAYRLGGDEFCVLAEVSPDGAGALLEATSVALSEEGDGFSVSTSLGAVFLPEEAHTSSEALRLADQRLYAHKHSYEFARTRPHEVLLQAISEREPTLLAHSHAVAELSLAVGRRLGFDDRALEELRVAAELHDVGKLAIPDTILEKPGPLDDDEWEFVRRHTVVGERIVAASPALQEVARVIRASHERWDGDGYVDRLAGDEIPLAARIIFACDAFEAMTTERPYRPRLDREAALEVIRRQAGSQFDPAVVSALVEAVSALAASEARCSPSAPAPRAATRAS